MSVAPVETEFGRKREIDQSSCNKDFSCVEGFCPSFVTVLGGRLRQGRALEPVGGLGAAGGLAASGGLAPAGATAIAEHSVGTWELPEPTLPAAVRPYGILVTGVGGTGIVMVGALLGTAATLEGKGVTVLDMAGLAQKGGPVWSHIRIADSEADLILGCDIVVAVADDTLAKMREGVTHAVLNSDFSVTSDFVRTFAAQANSGDVTHIPDPQFPLAAMEAEIAEAVGAGNIHCVAATRIATALMGDAIATNLFMVGYAWQQGLIPVAAASILKAIEINKAGVAMNKAAFLWGRRAAVDLAAVERAATPPEGLPASRTLSANTDERITRRVADLTEYQDSSYASRYAKLVQRVRDSEARIVPGHTELTEAVARYYYKLLAYKDEYEVARLYTQSRFLERLDAMFEGDYKVVFNLAPPLWASRDKLTGVPRKREYGPWILPVLRLLARLKFLRGTKLDPFARSADRKLDRSLLAGYERAIDALLEALSPANHAVAVELAALPEAIRGYGHIRRRHAEHTEQRKAELMAKLGGQQVADRPPHAGVQESRSSIVMAG